MSAFLNQESISDAKFDSLTRSFVKNTQCYGVFETMQIDNSNLVQFQERHLARLLKGIESIQTESLAFPELDLTMIADYFKQDVDFFKTQFSSNPSLPDIIRYQIVLNESEPLHIKRMLKSRVATLPTFSNVKIKICKTILPENTSKQGRKDIDRRVYEKALKELDSKFYDGILCDKYGHVVEGIKTNIFAIKNNDLYTPSLNLSGVAGIMRQALIERAQEAGLNVIIAPLHYLALMQMDGVFLTNSVIGVVKVDYVLRPDRKRSVNIFQPESVGYQNILALKLLKNNSLFKRVKR